ncbi:MAG: class III signal peptide-containing protein [Euryarchaeota archaeon]|nr:class III signal peptide-containing protein [Euryarchaeota archaeon]
MKILKEERAQGSAELILLVGGVIVVAIVAAITYRNYLNGIGNQINTTELNNVTNAINGLKNKFQ